MKLQLIRNATLKLVYGGRTILIDPYFAPRHSLPSYTGKSENPLVELPCPIEDILEGVERVIVSHLHSDHFDTVAKARLPKDLSILCQPGDEETIRAAGFVDVTPLDDRVAWQGITITRQQGSHGLGPVLVKMGSVMGFSLEAPGEPKIYWAGDTVLYPPVLDQVAMTRPNVIVTHSCGALWDGDLIVMDAAETLELCKAAPFATVIATHMEALDHATTSRADLRTAADAAGIAHMRLLIPQDGDEISLDA
jgi:L-ascorbate metabolism protein UlaG (beta-lactamase superfamily)